MSDTSAVSQASPKPRLSIVLVIYKMADQAERTLLSLSPGYQQGADAGDYEVIVVENRSDQILGEDRAKKHDENVRYFLRDETQRTPVHAVNFGVDQARGDHVAVVIDGARMVTPGVVRQTLKAFAADPEAAVSAPGYHLGRELQQVAVNSGYDEQVEAELMASIAWPEDGYRLFDIAVFSGSSRRGFFGPSYESNFIATSVDKWRRIGGMDPRYDDFGGGMANLDLYKRLVEAPDTPLYLLFAEGCFHQFHGGVTTGTRKDERDLVMDQIRKQDLAIRGDRAGEPQAQTILFGAPHGAVYRFIRQSLDHVSPP